MPVPQDDFDLETNTSKPRKKLEKITPAKEPSEKPASKKKNEPVSVYAEDGIGDEARQQLRYVVARVVRLEDEKAGIADDIKEVYAEAKSCGYDTKLIRKAIALLRQDPQEREEQQAILHLYMDAIGEYLEMEEES